MANPAYSTSPWADPTVAGEHWKDAPTAGNTITRLLSVATTQAKAYAPALADTDLIPDNYVLAVVLQARELWNAAQRGEIDIIGVGDYALRARPLTGAVRALLRPETGVPGIG